MSTTSNRRNPGQTTARQPHVAGFGTWTSPITSAVIVGDAISLDQVQIDGNDIYWIEGRPREQGRCVLVRHRALPPLPGVSATDVPAHTGATEDVLPAPWNVRTRVHEYGGGAYLAEGGVVYFSHFSDQQLYQATADGVAPGTPLPLRTGDTARYADACLDRHRQRLIAVREVHGDTTREAINSLVAIDLAGVAPERTLVTGSDFYAAPRLSPDGTQLAWLSWEHPDMPWDGTCLWLANIGDEGTVQTPVLVAGGRRESICQPAWSPSGELHFVSDRSGWWNICRLRAGAVTPLQPMAAEFGRAHWNFGLCTYGFERNGNLLCSFLQDGSWQLARLDAVTLQMHRIAIPFRSITDLKVGNGFAVLIAGAPDTPNSIVHIDLDAALATPAVTVLQRAVSLKLDPAFLSVPVAIEFPTTHARTAHAFFYAPCNPDFTAPPDERAPLLVISHGGPTSSASATLNLAIQFWTSRGFAVVDVNYGGSTGYGRAYRERLYGQWGVVDVDDAIAAARYLVATGMVDPARLAIRGSSAGGYTTLAALTFHDYFKAGASYYGVSDLEALARDCHKFESRYLDHLVGPYPAQQATYVARSPIHFVDQLAVPLILLQGLEDKVVPPDQSQAMFDALNAKGLPVAYLTFPDEQHGFRRADNIRRAMDAELYFYGRVFGFTAHTAFAPVEIHNLP